MPSAIVSGTVAASNFAIMGNSSQTDVPMCRLCGKVGFKSPDCPTSSCRGYYAANRSGGINNNGAPKSSDSSPAAASGIQQMIDAVEDDDEPLPWIQGIGMHICGEISTTQSEVLASVSSQLEKLACVLVQKGIKMNPWCLLLDTGSTHHVFSNHRLLSNIRVSDVRLRINSQAGEKTVGEVGDFVGLQDKVWFDPTGPMNVISFALIQAQYRVTYDNSQSNSFYIQDR